MELWINQLTDVVTQLLGNPATMNEALTIAVPTLLLGIPIVNKIAEGCRLANASMGMAIVLMAFGLVITIAALTASQVFLIETEKVPASAALWVQIGVGVAAAIILVVPVQKLLMKGNYLSNLMTWGIFSLYAAAMIFVMGMLWNTLSTSGKDMKDAQGRRDSLQQIIDQ